MKKIILCLALVTAISFAAAVNAAETQTQRSQNPVDQLTGTVWQNSKAENKKAVLFGIDTAIAVEQAIQDRLAERAAKNRKKAPDTLSVFEKKWMEAFKDMSRDQIVEQIDQFYAANPNDLERPVMDVIWYEIIVPRTGGAPKK